MEIWKDIKGYEGIYQVSNMGRFKSLPRITGAAHECNLEEKILKPIHKRRNNGKPGYLVVNLCKDKKHHIKYAHRVVAETFIDNPEDKPTVNHINGDKHDNRVENLEWATYEDNNRHAIETGLITTEARRNAKRKNNTQIWQYDKDMNLIAVYPSLREAERQTHVNNKGITEGIKKGWKSGGFIWRDKPA